MKAEKSKKWLIAPIILLALSLFFKFALLGYGYIALVLFGFAALSVLWHFLGRKLRAVLAVLVAAGIIAFIIIEIPIIKAARTDAPADCEYIVVLGAGVNGTVPSLSLETRLIAARDYLEANPDAVAIVSGGQGPGEDITEAEAMRRYLEAEGIDPARIIKEDKATNTLENLGNSFSIIESRGDTTDNVAVVSSMYHLYRAKLLAETLGVTVTGVAAPMGYPLVNVNYFIREGCGRLYYWVFGVEA